MDFEFDFSDVPEEEFAESEAQYAEWEEMYSDDDYFLIII